MKFNSLALLHAFALGAILMGVIAKYNYSGLIWGFICLVISVLTNINNLKDLNE